MVSRKTVNTLLVSAVALSVAGTIGKANAMGEGQEKCFGVVKAGANDCANADKSHSCAGQAAEDASAGEWIALPVGTCDKLAGGSLGDAVSADDAEHMHDATEDGAEH